MAFVQAIPLFTLLQGIFKAFISCTIQNLAAQSFSQLWHIRTLINHSQDIGISILRSIIWILGHIKTLINRLQDLGISELWSIIYKIWAYPDSDQSFARLWHNRISMNHSQDSEQSLAKLAYLTHNGHMFGYSKVLQMTDQSLDMPKSCEQLIGVLICPSLVNDWAEFW